MALTDSLESYWKLDEASGNATDSHGSNTLTDVNSVGAATGKIGGARDFESGSSQALTSTDNASLSTGNIDFTFACWFKLESLMAGNSSILGKGATASSFDYRLAVFTFGGGVRFGIGNGTSIQNFSFSTVLNTGTWYFVVAWHDSVNNQLGIRLNGGADNTTAATINPQDSAAGFAIGRSGDSTEYFDGLIDEVGFWKRLLTSQEKTDLYNGGAGLAYPFLPPQTASGVVRFSNSATVIVTVLPTASGVVRFSGSSSAAQLVTHDAQGEGVVVVGDASAASLLVAYQGAGRLVVGDASEAGQLVTHQANGVVHVGGEADASLSIVFTHQAIGVVVLGGTTEVSQAIAYDASGAVQIGHGVETALALPFASTGILALAGSADASFTEVEASFLYSAEGVLVVGGAATVSIHEQGLGCRNAVVQPGNRASVVSGGGSVSVAGANRVSVVRDGKRLSVAGKAKGTVVCG